MASLAPAGAPHQGDPNQGVLNLGVRQDVAGTAPAASLASSRRGPVAQNRQQKAAPLPPVMSKQDELALACPLAEHPPAESRWEWGLADEGLRLGPRQGRSVSARRGLSERQGQFRVLQ